MINQSLAGSWQFRQSSLSPQGSTTEWLPATVPGGVHTDLLALNKISDPFVADNELKVQWIAESDWEYRRTFMVEKALAREKRQFLVCDGLDTLAEVSLNGKLLGKTDNMFRQWKWDVTGRLKQGENVLAILFRAPVSFIKARQAEKPLIGGGDIPGGPHLRKAPCQWGWDWGPKLPPIGVWKDIRLEGYSKARFEDVHIRQSHADGKVSLSAEVRLEAWDAAKYQVTLKITSPDGAGSDGHCQSRGERNRIVNHQSTIENQKSPTLVAQWIWRAATLPGGSESRIRQSPSSTAAPTRSGCARWNCAANPISGASRSPSSSTACPSSPRARTGSRPIPSPPASRDAHLERLIRDAADGAHEHAARVGRRVLRRGALLRPVRPLRPAGLAGLHVCLRDLPGRRRLCRECARRKPSRTSAACATAPAWRCGAATTRWNRAGWTGNGTTRRTPPSSA